MTERLHDAPHESTKADETRVPMNWFAVQAAQLEGAKMIVSSVGASVDQVRVQRDIATEAGHEHKLAMCNLAIDAIKSATVCARNDKYGNQTDLYSLSLRKTAQTLLDKREDVAVAQARTKIVS